MIGPAAVHERDGVVAVAGQLVVELDVVDVQTRHGGPPCVGRPRNRQRSPSKAWDRPSRRGVSGVSDDVPVHGMLGRVRAPGSRSYRVLEVAAELGMHGGYLADRTANTRGHGGARPF